MTSALNFLRREQSERDFILTKRIYFDIAGTLEGGVFLSCLIGLNLERNSEEFVWIGKKRYEWWDLLRISPRKFDRIIEKLKNKKLIDVRVVGYGDEKQTEVKINDKIFLSRWKYFLENEPKNPYFPGNKSDQNHQTVTSISPNGEIAQNHQMVRLASKSPNGENGDESSKWGENSQRRDDFTPLVGGKDSLRPDFKAEVGEAENEMPEKMAELKSDDAVYINSIYLKNRIDTIESKAEDNKRESSFKNLIKGPGKNKIVKSSQKKYTDEQWNLLKELQKIYENHCGKINWAQGNMKAMEVLIESNITPKDLDDVLTRMRQEEFWRRVPPLPRSTASQIVYRLKNELKPGYCRYNAEEIFAKDENLQRKLREIDEKGEIDREFPDVW